MGSTHQLHFQKTSKHVSSSSSLNMLYQLDQLYQEELDLHGFANALNSIGDLESRLVDIGGANTHFGDAERLFREERADLFRLMGDMKSSLGDIDAAKERYAGAERCKVAN